MNYQILNKAGEIVGGASCMEFAHKMAQALRRAYSDDDFTVN